ncbi:FecR family protein [Sphingobacterium spiritivorum]|uniref:FecR family protein n=1 Tax=Sphingobacterium spiritivorum TaxID=258 RepID=UPI003DA58009
MENQYRIIYLLTGKRKGILSEEELVELEEWISNEGSNRLFAERLADQNNREESLNKLQYFADYQSLSQFKHSHQHLKPALRKSFLKNLPSHYWAAAVLFIFCSAIVLYFTISSQPVQQEDQLTRAGKDISPGKDQAILQLADGKHIALEELKNGESLDINGLRILKSADGEISYSSSSAVSDVQPTNRIVTPRGGQYKVRLSDGTRVWLGAESELEYAVQFGPEKREVKLSGEAFFEVTHVQNKQNENIPFQVRMSSQTIEVLGTSFNVAAYPQDRTNRTTLVNGKIRINTAYSSNILRPGQQALVSKDGKNIQVYEVDVSNMDEWKNKSFRFEEESIQEIMNKIARWYDVDVVYEGKITEELFSGVVSKYENPAKVLKLLELTGKVKFRIEGRRIIVMA